MVCVLILYFDSPVRHTKVITAYVSEEKYKRIDIHMILTQVLNVDGVNNLILFIV